MLSLVYPSQSISKVYSTLDLAFIYTGNNWIFVVCFQLYRNLLLHFLLELIKITASRSFLTSVSHLVIDLIQTQQ